MIYRNVNAERECYEVWYDTLDDILSETESSHNTGRINQVDLDPKQYGVRNRKELDKLLRDGWDEGVTQAQELGRTLSAPRLKNVRRVKRRSDFGDSIDMQAVYGGDLDRAWETARREITPSAAGNALTIAVDIDASWRRSAQEMTWTGAVAVRLVDLLTQSGRSVRVLAYQGGRYSYRGHDNFLHAEMVFVAKEYADPLDVSRLMITLGHAGFFRLYGWLALASAQSQLTGGLGSPAHEVPMLIYERESRNNILDIPRVWHQSTAQALLEETLALVSGPKVEAA